MCQELFYSLLLNTFVNVFRVSDQDKLTTFQLLSLVECNCTKVVIFSGFVIDIHPKMYPGNNAGHTQCSINMCKTN